MSSTNRGSSTTQADFYATPAWATRAILPHLPRTSTALDPCCGKGAIMRVVAERIGADLCDGMEIDEALGREAVDVGHVLLVDALSLVEWPPYGCVIMNPPFSQAMAFMTKALAETQPSGGTLAALLRLGMMASQGRAAFWRANPCDVYVLPKRPSFTPDGKTDSADYAWFVWGPGRIGRWQVLDLGASVHALPDTAFEFKEPA